MSTKILTANYTLDGVPTTGLTPTVTIILLDADDPTTNTIVVSGGVCTEVGLGWYRYDFTGYEVTENYLFSFDAGLGVPAYARWLHGANDVNSADTWDQPYLNHMEIGSFGYSQTQIKADTTNILTTALPAIHADVQNVPAAVRAELTTELAHIISLYNGLTPAQALMLLEIYTMYGLDPTKPLVVDLTNPAHGSRTFGTVNQTIDVAGNKTTVTRTT